MAIKPPLKSEAANHRISLDDLPSSALLDDPQLTEVLDLGPGTLSVWRCTGRVDLPYLKIGRSVRYRVGDVKEFLEKCKHASTGYQYER